MVAITLSADAPVVSLDGTRVTANTPEGIAAIEEFRKIIAHPGQVPANEVWSGAWGSADTAVSTGLAAMCWTGNWSFGIMEENGIDYMSIPAPIVPGGQPRAGSYINCLVVPESSANKEAAWTFIQWALSKEGQVSFASFSDSPVNDEAADIVAAERNAENQDGFGAFNIGERYPYASLPTDFNMMWDEMIEDLQLGTITAAEFAERLESEGQPMIDEYLANIAR